MLSLTEILLPSIAVARRGYHVIRFHDIPMPIAQIDYFREVRRGGVGDRSPRIVFLQAHHRRIPVFRVSDNPCFGPHWSKPDQRWIHSHREAKESLVPRAAPKASAAAEAGGILEAGRANHYIGLENLQTHVNPSHGLAGVS
jgi:hypothetical protein